ncbi:MAG: Stk1 family PASTA domain-containing Ser/Thr kinase [Ruminococcaceae bacterium]|nr:Stk1 family PASTA domain-containing Ser/Thr kinase [Oscillospiraceae bacterium]
MDMDKYIGRLLDNRYEILEVIGTGGMAVVYKARCHRLNRLVAIKILRAEYTQDEEFRRRFHAESQAVAMLSHPNIVSVYDVSTTDEADYIVMELIDGITLKQYMEKKGTLNWKETLHFAIQIAKALDHAHSRGIIHRDIKPHNVMVLKNGSVKVTDFGIARVMSESNTLTKEALGSVHYISPEQAKGGQVDNRSDLYSLGVVMYEMTAGRTPYDGETPVAVAIQHINGKAIMPSMLNPNVPGGLEQIIIRSMSRNPKERYPSAGALLTDLDEFRKNPTILFDYNNPNTDMDAATRLQPPKRDLDETMPLPKTVAERTAARATPPRQRPVSGGAAPAPAKKPARRKEVIVEEKEERSKVATIAMIACGAVALIAIVLLCIALFGGGSSEELTNAPNLIGQMYDENKDYGDVLVEISNKQYSDEYAKGVIMDQTPKANKQMAKGDTVRVVVSLGPQPEEKVMVDLTRVPQQQAIDFLNAMDIDLQFLPKMENSSEVEKGCVIRTDPVDGEPLEKGQTVYLWISTGPLKQTAKVPGVVGRNRTVAEQIMIGSQFNNVTFEEVESAEPVGTVVEQSINEGIEVDINTPITLKVSKGMPSTGGDSTTPTPDPDNSVAMVIPVIFENPLDRTCVLSVWKGSELVVEQTVYAGTVSVEVKLYGEGVETFTAQLDRDVSTAWTFQVDFTDDDLGV